MKNYTIYLIGNESQDWSHEGNTANFEIPSHLENFTLKADQIETALEAAKSKLLAISNGFDDMEYESTGNEELEFWFGNGEDGLILRYGIE